MTIAAARALLLAPALALPLAAAAQGQVAGDSSGAGSLPWVFAAFAAAALLVVFLVALWLLRRPEATVRRRAPP